MSRIAIPLSLQVCEDDDLSADSMLRLNAGYKKYWFLACSSTEGVGGVGEGVGTFIVCAYGIKGRHDDCMANLQYTQHNEQCFQSVVYNSCLPGSQDGKLHVLFDVLRRLLLQWEAKGQRVS